MVQIGQAKSGAASPKTFAKRDDSPVVYEVDKQILADVEKEAFDLQNKELVTWTGRRSGRWCSSRRPAKSRSRA